ncbi:MAG TPA: IPT/TIG domain-containing protein [Thermoanaerobaculia bacterium]|jgi:hypothetical protein|nr:IPT/TIG domain-containing protein [Thermoanaerobaculia bacterium]
MNENKDAQQEVIPGDGPGRGYVSKTGIGVIMGLFCLLALGLLSLLVWSWPDPEPTPASTSISAVKASAAGKPSPGNAASTNPADTTPADKTTKSGGDAAPPDIELKITGISPSSSDLNGGPLALISGSGFADPVTVKFGEIQATDVAVVSKELIRVKVPAHAVGPVDVSVKADGKTTELSQGFAYRESLKPRAVLLLVLLAGALGGTLYSLISLSWYIGNRELKWSWVPSYLVRPLTAAALASIFFLTLVTGVWPDQTGKGQLWIVGVSALVGLFSKQGYEKLKTIFEAVLAPAPKGADTPKTAPVGGLALDKNSGPFAGGGIVQITGSGFTSATTVQFGAVAATSVRVDSPTILHVVVPSQAAPGQVNVTVTNPGNPPVIRTVQYTYI